MIILTDKDGKIVDKERHWHYPVCSMTSGYYPSGSPGCICLRAFRKLINEKI